MLTRFLALGVLLIGLQSAFGAERSLVVARRTTAGAIVAAPRAAERSVVVASREVPVEKLDETAETIALIKQKERELERLQAEIRQLKAGLGNDAQIVIRIEMLEVSLSKLRRMGDDFTIPLGPSKGKVFKSYLDSLVENHAAKTLCQPNLVVTSGRPASFHVGGEIPIPSRDDPKAAVAFQMFGTAVDLLAIVTDSEHVRMELRVKQSEIDEARIIDINGSKIPALSTRQCDTAVEAKFGEPVVLNGFVSTGTENVKSSDGQMKDQDNEIMLLVVVTPELVESKTPRNADTGKPPKK